MESLSSSTFALVIAEPGDHEALARLCRRHWKPVHWQLATHRIDRDEEALTLTESFFAWLFSADAKRFISEAQSLRGCLAVAIEHFTSREPSTDAQLSSDPVESFLTPQSIAGSDRIPPNWSPDSDFDELFATALIEDVALELSAQLVETGKDTKRLAFEAWFLGHKRPDQASLASELGLNEELLSEMLEHARRALRSLLRTRLADTLLHIDDLEAEFDWLFGREKEHV